MDVPDHGHIKCGENNEINQYFKLPIQSGWRTAWKQAQYFELW